MAAPIAAVAPAVAKGAGLKKLATLVGPTLLNQFGALFGARRQERANIRAMQMQNEFNIDMLNRQLEWNAPKNQMQRFADAGLNPNLIYGQASSGNWSTNVQSAPLHAADYQTAPAMLGQQLLESLVKAQQVDLIHSQADLNRVRKSESGIKQDLMKAQTALTRANPYLDPAYVKAMVVQLQSVAHMKEMESNALSAVVTPSGQDIPREMGTTIMDRMVIAKINSLEERFDLQKADARVKAEIIKSKEFQNALQEIQVAWMKDGELTPQHVYTGIMMLLGKLMPVLPALIRTTPQSTKPAKK